MTNAYQRRLDRIEQAVSPKNQALIWREWGETTAGAIERFASQRGTTVAALRDNCTLTVLGWGRPNE